ncbi:MAG: AsmA family protein [Alphaproteobacteria bacterium]|nr:AsmA family protein [Alphaproteobacteria bacterium]
MKKILYGLVALIGLVLVLALVGPSFVDWSRYKGEIERKTKELTGRDLVIGGPISVSILPKPTLVAEDIRLDNIPGAAVADMVTLKSLRLRLALFPLLAGRIRVDNITLVRPVVELETMADGRVNWILTPAASANPKSDGNSEPVEAAKADEGFPRLDPLIVQEGVIVYRDSRTGHIERADAIAAQLSVQSAAGPFRAQGTAMPRGLPARFNISVGRLGADTPSAVSVSLEFDPGQARLDFNGILVAAKNNREELSGKLHAEAGDLIKLTNAFLGGAASDQLPILVNRFILDGTIQSSDSNLSIADLSLTMGESKATGAVDMAFGKTTDVKARVTADRVDLDALLKPPAPPQAAPAKPAEAPALTGKKSQASKAETPVGFALPTNVNGTLDLSAATVVYNGQETKDLRVAAALQNGRLAIEKAEARLPGDTAVSLNGALSTRKGAFAVDGSAKLATNNVRSLLSWLKLKVDEIPEGKLTTATFAGNFATSGEEIQLRDIQATLDGSRLAGGATLALRQRPAIAASLAVDRLMIDAYLPAAKKDDSGGGGTQSASSSGDGAGGQAPVNAPLAALAPLQSFDANVKLRAGLLSYHGLQAQDVSFDGTLLDNVLTVRDLSAKNVAGAQAKFTGTVGGFTGMPMVKANLDVRANEAGPVLKALGLPVPASASKLGRFVLTGAADTDGKNVTLDLQLAAANGKLAVKGKAADVDTAAKYDMTLDLDHPDLGWFLGNADEKTARRPFTLKAKVKGAPGQGGQDMDVDAVLAFADGALKAKGKAVAVPASSKYDMDFNADFPDTAAFLRALSPSTKVAGKLGPTKLVAKLQGDPTNVAFTGLNGNIGPANVSGEARANYAGPRAKYTVNLTTGDMPGEFFGAPAAASVPAARAAAPGGGAAAGGAASKTEHWSREPIDLAWLSANDAEIKLQSSGIRLGKYRVANAQVEAVLANGVLELRRFTGKLFDGNLDVKGKLVGGTARNLETTFSLDQFDVQQAMHTLADSDRATGRASIRGNLRGVPRTEYDLVSTLDGQAAIDGTVTARVDASTRGATAVADLISAKLIQSLSGTMDTLLTAAAGSDSGKLKGTFKVERGVIRTNDLQLVNSRPPGVTAQVTGTVDLPAWTINGQGQVVSRTSTTPMLTVAASGALDRPNVKVGGTVVQDLTQQVIPGLINALQGKKKAPAQ